MLLLALQLDPRLDAVLRPLEGLLQRGRRHVLVVEAHEVPAEKHQAVGAELETRRNAWFRSE